MPPNKDPADHEYDADRQIAREFAITRMVQEADKARLLGHLDVARARLSGALALDPQNPGGFAAHRRPGEALTRRRSLPRTQR